MQKRDEGGSGNGAPFFPETMRPVAPALNWPRWMLYLRDKLSRPPDEFYRCDTDGAIVTERHLEAHRGHRLKQPVYFRFSEWVLVNLRIIR